MAAGCFPVCCSSFGMGVAGFFAFGATASVAFGSWMLAAVFGLFTIATVCSAGCRSLPEDATEEDIEKQAEQKRRCRYLTLQWSLQILVTLFCLVFTLWAAIMATSILNVIGIKTEPPGLRVGVASFEDR